VLTNTVARFVTLRQAAFVTGVDLKDLLSYLCQRVGQAPLDEVPGPQDEPVPKWLSQEPAITLDVQKLLKKNQNLLQAVSTALQKVEPGQIVLLRSPFRPEPLMEMMQKRGVEVYGAQEGADYFTYFKKPE
jgi:hypothetical protein